MKKVVYCALAAAKKYLCLFLLALMPMVALQAKTNKVTVVLSCDLHCQGCCDKIMKNIAFEKGVKDIRCDLKTKTVTLTYDADKTNLPVLLQAFDKIGKPATVKEEPKDEEKKAVDAQTGASTPQ